MGKFECLYTKRQIQNILIGWECNEPLPKKGSRLIVCWPKPTTPEAASVAWTEKKSDCGDRLYLVVMGTAAEVLGVGA